jgi:hypothetical protein
MSRTVGSITSETLITVPVQRNYVMTAKGKHYIYLAHVQPKVYEATAKAMGSRAMYDSFNRAIRHGLYNMVKIYGLDAINIEDPQVTLVSIRLKFKLIDEDQNDVCTFKVIKKAEPKAEKE